ncbi:dolichol-phosphate mannosyltransferase subunit 3 [Pyrrhoderma noxium]|uniref:Dolichol-phosphate mannosyltransferase subunit 3 n=1 Tax=Pyrrhoderma noxium TaxID=2282107 RepID=A0A286UTG0_9AGAM|nr:dolichol-phosphate mannosyltransferase subunit 3 [Pyrrhoderma noxium]
MTRLTRFAAWSGVFTVVYALVWLRVLSVPFLDASIVEQLLPVIPWWLLVSFGSYSLASLGLGLYTFNDTPDAYEELMKEIAEAKNDLRAKGVTVD